MVACEVFRASTKIAPVVVTGAGTGVGAGVGTCVGAVVCSFFGFLCIANIFSNSSSPSFFIASKLNLFSYYCWYY